jgi:hypothetical protein
MLENKGGKLLHVFNEKLEDHRQLSLGLIES